MKTVDKSLARNGTNTRDAIIEAAYRLLTENGYYGTSMRDIAAQAGITAGSIYNHFTDKGQIVEAVILKYHPVIRVLPILSEAEGISTPDLISDAAHRLIQMVDAEPGVLKLVFVELIDLGGKHIPGLIGAMLPHVQRFMDQVYASGDVDRRQDPVIPFSAFVGILLGYIIARWIQSRMPDKQSSDMELDAYIQIFLWGMMRRPEKLQ